MSRYLKLLFFFFTMWIPVGCIRQFDSSNHWRAFANNHVQLGLLLAAASTGFQHRFRRVQSNPVEQ